MKCLVSCMNNRAYAGTLFRGLSRIISGPMVSSGFEISAINQSINEEISS